MNFILYIGIICLTFSFIPVSGNKYVGLSIIILSFIFFRYLRRFTNQFTFCFVLSGVLIFIQSLLLFDYELSILPFLQFFVFCFFISLAISIDVDDDVSDVLLFYINSACYYALISLFFLVSLQFIEFHFVGSHYFVNLLASLQIYPNSYIINQIEQGYFRAIGSYFEPSFLALVVSVLWVILCCSGKANKKEDILFISIMLMSKSSLGVFTACLLLLFKYVANKNVKDFLIGICVLMIVFPVVFYLGESLFLRLHELNYEGSSGYYRMIAPIFLIDWVLFDRIIPIPLGDIESYMSSFGIMNGEQVGTSIDNGYYVVLAHFSWVGIIFCIYFFYKMILGVTRSLIIGKNQCLAYLLFLIMPLYTGAIFSPEFLFVSVLLIFSTRFQSNMAFNHVVVCHSNI